MKLLEGTATDLPGWVRFVFALLALAFLALAWWLATGPQTGLVSGAAAALSAGAALLLVSAARGKIWRWQWLVSG